MTDFTQIRYDVADSIATITLNRPEKMNAFTNVMMREMCSAFDLVDADDAVRAVIVTGSGDRAFCAGADLTPDGGGDVPVSIVGVTSRGPSPSGRLSTLLDQSLLDDDYDDDVDDDVDDDSEDAEVEVLATG